MDPNSANLIITGYVRSVPTCIYFLLQYKVIKKCIGTGFACSVKHVRMYMSSVSLPQRLHNLSVD